MFVILWEFQVKPGFEAEFAAVYGADGDWASLFRVSSAYRGTRLSRDLDRDGWYFTLDLWESQQSHDVFRAEYSDSYDELDQRCGRLTLRENHIGSFTAAPND